MTSIRKKLFINGILLLQLFIAPMIFSLITAHSGQCDDDLYNLIRDRKSFDGKTFKQNVWILLKRFHDDEGELIVTSANSLNIFNGPTPSATSDTVEGAITVVYQYRSSLYNNAIQAKSIIRFRRNTLYKLEGTYSYDTEKVLQLLPENSYYVIFTLMQINYTFNQSYNQVWHIKLSKHRNLRFGPRGQIMHLYPAIYTPDDTENP
ncbi:MAG: hypothetical protein ISR65_11235 [Bacteriovoracaceae bacterium]|nr:hypothetical protein [Bacteriovoracaceae bacterium]